MGLDQYFFTENNYNANEVFYFRKYHGLQDFVADVVVSPIPYGFPVRLRKHHIESMIDFVINDTENYLMYDEDRPTETMLNFLGLLAYHKNTGKPLYYGADW